MSIYTLVWTNGTEKHFCIFVDFTMITAIFTCFKCLAAVLFFCVKQSKSYVMYRNNNIINNLLIQLCIYLTYVRPFVAMLGHMDIQRSNLLKCFVAYRAHYSVFMYIQMVLYVALSTVSCGTYPRTLIAMVYLMGIG